MSGNNREQEQTTPSSLKSSLKYKPIKDSILIAFSACLVAIITAASFLLKPRADSDHVEIRYQDILLYDPADPLKQTAIPFEEEEKKITFHKEDGSLFLGEGNEFDFVSDTVSITLYPDFSIQILTEDITCPDHTCSRMGRIDSTYTPIVCLPNHIQAMIVADEFPEWDA